MKIDFNNVAFADECRATLNGPDGFKARKKPLFGNVMFLAAIHDLNFISPFKVEGGVKMNSANYQQLLTSHSLPYYR